MIKVRIKLSSEELITYHSQGHAGDNQGRKEGLVVCNGLSAIEYQFLYAVKSLCPEWAGDEGVVFKVDKGDFFMDLRRLPKFEEFRVYKVLSRALVIGVEMLKKHHPDEIDVKILDKL